MNWTKSTIRREMLCRRRSLPPETITAGSEAVCRTLLRLTVLLQADIVAVYAAFAGEIDLRPLMLGLEQTGRRYYLPRFEAERKCYGMVMVSCIETDTAPGQFGILEPHGHLPTAEAERLNSEQVVWIVPGVAFDREGNRIGQGAGYYDRLLRDTSGCRIGVGYDWQLVERIPHESFDVRMDLVVTDRRTVTIRRSEPDVQPKMN